MRTYTSEEIEVIRDRGEEIVKILIKDNGNSVSNFYSMLRTCNKVKNNDLGPNLSDADRLRYIETYAAGGKTLKIMEQMKTLLDDIIDAYKGK